jgi:hypothetical protein
MGQSLIICLLFYLPVFGFAQRFNFKQRKASAIGLLQNEDKAKKVTYNYSIGVAEDYFPNRRKYRLAQPINFVKEDRTFQYQTAYYFSEPDSIIRLIEYQWEGTDSTTDTAFNLVVEKNKALVSCFFKSKGQDYPATETKSAKTVWDNKTVHVEQFFIPEMLRIRVLVSWK